MPVLCHVWPGITPFNVWDLPYSEWLMFKAHADAWSKAHADAWSKAREEENRRNRG